MIKQNSIKWELIYESHFKLIVFLSVPGQREKREGVGGEKKSIIEREKSPSAAGEDSLPAWGNFLALCGCDASLTQRTKTTTNQTFMQKEKKKNCIETLTKTDKNISR